MQGSILYFNADHGYGFIETDDRKNTFFHIRDCISPEEELQGGAVVDYDIMEYDKNGEVMTKAVNVQVIE